MTITKTQLKILLVTLHPQAKARRQSVDAWLVRYLCGLAGGEVEINLKDISLHGCISGAVGPLIYYTDCIAFYDTFSASIWEKIEEFLDTTGQSLGDFLNGFSTPLDSEVHFKTSLAWFAVEASATVFLEKLGVW